MMTPDRASRFDRAVELFTAGRTSATDVRAPATKPAAADCNIGYSVAGETIPQARQNEDQSEAAPTFRTTKVARAARLKRASLFIFVPSTL